MKFAQDPQILPNGDAQHPRPRTGKTRRDKNNGVQRFHPNHRVWDETEKRFRRTWK